MLNVYWSGNLAGSTLAGSTLACSELLSALAHTNDGKMSKRQDIRGLNINKTPHFYYYGYCSLDNNPFVYLPSVSNLVESALNNAKLLKCNCKVAIVKADDD
jgi:hypothetical protein